MKPIIGIVLRPLLSEENNEMSGGYVEIVKAIEKNGGIPIGIFPGVKDLSFCNGLIFQGGDYFTNYEEEYIKYAYKKDIPVLGICLGMQLMCKLFEGVLFDVNNHKFKERKYVHQVNLNNKSKLYDIIKKDKINVNSRHKSAIKSTKLNIIGISEDGVIEAVEDSTKRFFVGVQWHPESMIDYDEYSNKIFEEFIGIAKT